MEDFTRSLARLTLIAPKIHRKSAHAVGMGVEVLECAVLKKIVVSYARKKMKAFKKNPIILRRDSEYESLSMED